MRSFAALGLALVLATPAVAQKAAPIREFDLKTTESLGQAIWRQDTAAWMATDALLAKVPDLAKAGVKGWLVEETDETRRVRFLRDVGQGLEAGYDIVVGPRDETRVSEPADRALTADEKAAFAARQTAAAHMGPACRPGYNSVVLHDPEHPQDWLVWMLAPMPKAGVAAVGGHYRFMISADGRTVIRRDALSASCLAVDPRQGIPDGARPVAFMATHLVSPTPVETHVFVQLQMGLTMYVAAGDKLWKIDNGHISLAPNR